MSSLTYFPSAWAEVSGEPVGVIKGSDIRRAKDNLERYEWAQGYRDSLKARVAPWIGKIDAAFLMRYLPEVTPGASLFTPCPSCRDKKRPYLPHGDWDWAPQKPEQLICKVCKESFPSGSYPESIVVETAWGKPQRFTYIGGEPFPIFGYKHGRPSMTGNIRSRKVGWVTGLLKDLSEVYALTDNLAYAEATKAILLRLADVYPHWLVHTGYGEIADMAPAAAAANVNRLPRAETVFPPNHPDRVLFSGYWQAGRARSEGMEGIFVRIVATAYDLTRFAKNPDGTMLYSEAEKQRIEKDLLAESIPLLFSDKAINNKSMGNRSAVGLVGIILGEPEWLRFGMEGFKRTVDEWFLSDGGTPESPAYAMMALNGVVDFGQALRGYSDPEGYTDGNGERYDRYDPYREPKYQKVWEAMVNTLHGDFTYPPFADSYKKTGIGTAFVELIAANYPENAQYQALRRELLKEQPPHAPYALYYSDAAVAERADADFSLSSHYLPDLRIGWLRTGKDGREALALLSASHWGVHHHLDSLNLTYWNGGEELLSDLGYLWDHPDKEMTMRTLAHNTVLLDQADQISTGRGGEVVGFVNEPQLRAMRASSAAYAQAEKYERSIALVDHGEGRHYLVDVFWVEGGAVQDYVYHGPNHQWAFATAVSVAQEEPGFFEQLRRWWSKQPALAPIVSYSQADLGDRKEPLYDLTNVKHWNELSASVRIQWAMTDGRLFSAWHLPAKGEQLYVGQGWGQRDSRNSDRGATLPYIVRRTNGQGLKTFVSIFEVSPEGKPMIQQITPLSGHESESGVVAIEVKTSKGRDLIMIAPDGKERRFTTPTGTLSAGGTLAVLSLEQQKVKFHYTDKGKIQFQHQSGK